jgi:hypothetical protein
VNSTPSFEILHDFNDQAIAEKIEKYDTSVKKKRNFLRINSSKT